MRIGTIQRMRARAMRQGNSAPWIRATRQRCLSTEHGHVALPQAIHAYQSDSSSKSPGPSAASGSRKLINGQNPGIDRGGLDNRSFHISPEGGRAGPSGNGPAPFWKGK